MSERILDRRQLKLDARAAMHGHKPSVYLVTIVFLLIIWVLEILSTKLQFPGVSVEELRTMYFSEASMQRVMRTVAQNRSFGGSLLDLAITIMSGIVSGGFMLFCLNVSRREAAGVGTLFDLFGWFFRYLWLNIVTGVLILLWSLLLVIPGIVAAYRYSMAPYVFFDDPEKGALQCIRESKAMTQGYKGQLFVLDLSFIGWAILSVIPLVNIFTMPYINVTRANYYRVLSGTDARQARQTASEDPWNT